MDSDPARRLAAVKRAVREALALPETPETLEGLLLEAEALRTAHWGRRVRIHRLANVKAGSCTEDCGFCAQSIRFAAPIARWGFLPREEMLAEADRAEAIGAAKVCYVAAIRGPSDRDVARISEVVREVKARHPRLRVCLSLGLLSENQARTLAAAGTDRFNHNLETSERHYPAVCSTHSWRDRVETVRRARGAGMEACCGGIVGMGETDEDLADLVGTLVELAVESVPVNFLVPRPGTPFADLPRLTPDRALRILCAFRIGLGGEVDLRVAAGRESVLGDRWTEGLRVANSFFTEGYLTTPGTPAAKDHEVLAALGYEACRD